MPLLNDLLDFRDHPLMPPPSTQLFAEHLPTEWIQHLLTLSAHATICRLNLSADGEAGMNLLARSAVTQARQRVGAAPVEWLFRQTAQTGARNVT